MSDSCDLMDYSVPVSSVHGILQARILGWVVIPSSRGIFPTQRSNLGLLYWRQILHHWATRENSSHWSKKQERPGLFHGTSLLTLWSLRDVLASCSLPLTGPQHLRCYTLGLTSHCVWIVPIPTVPFSILSWVWHPGVHFWKEIHIICSQRTISGVQG